MTSTTTFSGDSASKPSSRVLRPPGGVSSISFGSGDVDVPVQAKKAVIEPAKEVNVTPAAALEPVPAAAPEPVQPTAAATPVTQNQGPRKTCGYNPITGEAYSSEPAKPSIQVKQPPGGASTRPW